MAIEDTTPENLLDALRGLVSDLHQLIAESDGVAGLHRNGDTAFWGDLMAGGRYGGWLGGLTRAETEITKADKVTNTEAVHP